MPMDTTIYDVAVIGAGPAGSTAALYASRAKLKTVVLDQGPQPGTFGAAAWIATYPGVTGVVSGQKLLERLRKHAQTYGTQFKKVAVTHVVLRRDPKQLVTRDGRTFFARAVILASGSAGQAQMVPGELEYLGKGVSYCATCDGPLLKQEDALVYGSTEKAVDAALALARHTARVYIASPKPLLEIDEALRQRVQSIKPMTVLLGTRLKAIQGTSRVKHVILLAGSGEKRLQVSHVFMYTQPSKPATDYLGGQVELTEEGCVRVDAQMLTSVPGVFACGGLLRTEVQEAVAVAAQGCTAALSAERYLNRGLAAADPEPAHGSASVVEPIQHARI